METERGRKREREPVPAVRLLAVTAGKLINSRQPTIENKRTSSQAVFGNKRSSGLWEQAG